MLTFIILDTFFLILQQNLSFDVVQYARIFVHRMEVTAGKNIEHVNETHGQSFHLKQDVVPKKVRVSITLPAC